MYIYMIYVYIYIYTVYIYICDMMQPNEFHKSFIQSS